MKKKTFYITLLFLLIPFSVSADYIDTILENWNILSIDKENWIIKHHNSDKTSTYDTLTLSSEISNYVIKYKTNVWSMIVYWSDLNIYNIEIRSSVRTDSGWYYANDLQLVNTSLSTYTPIIYNESQDLMYTFWSSRNFSSVYWYLSSKSHYYFNIASNPWTPTITVSWITLNNDYYITPASILDISPWPSLVCTTENIPKYDFINIHPQSSEDVNEIIENSIENEYAYATSLSGENPLQVIFLWVENLIWFNDFMTQTWSLNFNTINNTSFWSDESFLTISTSSMISSIKLSWSYGNVDIIKYDSVWGNIQHTILNVDLDSFSAGDWYPIGANSPLVAIRFENSFWSKQLDSLEVYSVWYDTTQDVEICLNPDTQVYTIDDGSQDPYEYEWDPYVDLVWNPQTTETFFNNDWFLFYDNWFCLSNFTVTPTGGELIFEIRNPENKLVSSYPLRSSGIYQYWYGTCSKITTNYHNIAGTYYVRASYIYQWVKYYPMWENFFTYEITAPEFIDEIPTEYWDTKTCWGDTGAFSGVNNFFDCLSFNISWFFSKVWSYVSSIGDFFKTITTFWSPEEQRSFSFMDLIIPSTHASDPTPLDVINAFWSWYEEQDNIVSKAYYFIMYLVLGMCFICIIVLLILIRQKND